MAVIGHPYPYRFGSEEQTECDSTGYRPANDEAGSEAGTIITGNAGAVI